MNHTRTAKNKDEGFPMVETGVHLAHAFQLAAHSFLFTREMPQRAVVVFFLASLNHAGAV